MSLDIWLTIKVDVGIKELYNLTLYHANYTHNITPMWHLAGVYDILYNSNNKQCGQFIEMLEKGIVDMHIRSEEYIKLNPTNRWGSYKSALPWLEEFTTACKKYPKAVIKISR